MLCEAGAGNFFLTWFLLTVIAFIMILSTSGIVFYHYYWPSKITYEKWQYKTNPKFPTPEKVRDEIVQTAKGIFTATLCPALSMYLAAQGKSKAYCTPNPFVDPEHGGISHVVFTFFAVVLISDFWEWGYHRLGHVFSEFWNVHKHHHVFFNPSPFAVIADEYIDQFFRACPLLLFPLVAPINMDIMFFTYGLFFYAYGVYLHWGYETPLISAHNGVVNTAYHHYAHHSKAILNRPYHCGFFLQIWDQVMDKVSGAGVYPLDKCFCAKCERDKGMRTQALYKKVVKPDYTVLMQPGFWMGGGVFSGTSASDKNEVLMTEEEKFFNTKGNKGFKTGEEKKCD